MRITISQLRKIIREAIEGEDLALYVWTGQYDSPVIKVVLYSPSELLSLDWSNIYDIPKEVIKGYATFKQPANPKHKCNGAWEVTSIAGIGYGKILYGLGYSLVPGGRLMPDRMFSSKRARDAWAKSSGKMTGFPLDDIDDPQTPDPNDDCPMQVPVKKGGPDPLLDVAYQGQPVNPGPMEQVHKDTIVQLMNILNDLGGEYTNIDEVDDIVGEMLRSAGAEYFKSEFGKYMRER